MQSLHIPSDRWKGPRAGQQKLNGKLSKMCDCGCCECKNFKPKVEVKEKNKEIRAFDLANKEIERLSKDWKPIWDKLEKKMSL